MATVHCSFSKRSVFLIWPKWHNCLAKEWDRYAVCCSNKALKQSDSFSCFKGMHSFPFTLEINLTPSHTNLPISPPFQCFFSCLWQETNTRGLCCAVLRVKTRHPTQQLNLMLGDETGNRCHPWPSLLKHYWPSQSGAHPGGVGGSCWGGGSHRLLYYFSSHRVPSHWQY